MDDLQEKMQQVPDQSPLRSTRGIDTILAETETTTTSTEPTLVKLAPAESWETKTCHSTTHVLIGFLVFFTAVNVIKLFLDSRKKIDHTQSGKVFIQFCRTEAGFVPNLGSAESTPIEYDKSSIAVRAGANLRNKEFCRSIWRALKGVVGTSGSWYS